MKIKAVLLAGVALCTLSLSPALAKSKAPNIHVSALRHGARIKSVMQHKTSVAQTSSFSVYTAVSTAASYKVKTNLIYTFYAWDAYSDLCYEAAKQKVTLSTKKTTYAKLSTGVESYPGSDFGCTNIPTVKFYGDVYDLTSKTASGAIDIFESSLTAKLKIQKTTYDLTLNLSPIVVFIED